MTPAGVYRWLFERFRRFAPATVRQTTDDVATVIREFFYPTVTNHVIGDNPLEVEP